MAEAEWLACDEPTPMLESLGTAANSRKLRLFCCACCHRAAGLLTGDYVRHARNALTAFERHLEGQATDRDLEGAWGGVYRDAMDARHAIAHPGEADYYAISAAADAIDSIRRNDLSHAVSFAADAVAYDALARSGSPALARITTEWTPRNRPPAFSRERWAGFLSMGLPGLLGNRPPAFSREALGPERRGRSAATRVHGRACCRTAQAMCDAPRHLRQSVPPGHPPPVVAHAYCSNARRRHLR